MALLFVDSFDHYATAERTQKWTQVEPSGGTHTIANVGRRSTQGYRLQATGNNASLYGGYIRKTMDTPLASGATAIVGFAFRSVSAFGALGSDSAILHIVQGGSTQTRVLLDTSGRIVVQRNTTTLGTSSSGLTQNVYHFVEIKVLFHASAGTVNVRIDGINVLSLTGQNTLATSSATFDEVLLGGIRTTGTNSYEWNYDDYYVCDGSGSNNNDFLGDVRIDAVYPNANGTTRDFAPSTGTDDYAVVDDTLVNGDTDYLSASVAGDTVTMNFPNAPVAGADIFGVQLCVQGRKTDAGASGHKGVTRISGTDYAGTEVGLTSSYSIKRQVWEVKPSDSTDWTDSDFNAAEFGAEKST